MLHTAKEPLVPLNMKVMFCTSTRTGLPSILHVIKTKCLIMLEAVQSLVGEEVSNWSTARTHLCFHPLPLSVCILWPCSGQTYLSPSPKGTSCFPPSSLSTPIFYSYFKVQFPTFSEYSKSKVSVISTEKQ